jgi:uncharacterized membrane protein
MKKLHNAILIMLLVLLSARAFSGIQSEVIEKPVFYENLIPYSDFEADSLPWIYAWGNDKANFSLDKSSKLNGEGTLKIEVLKASTTGVWWDAGVKNSFDLEIAQGETYVFSFVAKADTIRQMHFDVKVGNIKFIDQAIALTADAKKFTFGFKATVSGKVTIQFMPTFHGATVYFDDLLFVKLPTNQIPNSDLEADTLPWHFGWGADAAKISRNTQSMVNGAGSLMIEVTKPSTSSWWDAGIRNSFPVYVEKGDTYIFSFAAKADTIRKMHFDIKVGDVKLLDTSADLNTDAKKFTYGFTSNVSGMVTIQLMPTIHGATVYFDDFSLTRAAQNQIANSNLEADNMPWHFGWGEAAARISLDKESKMNGAGSLMIEVTKPSTSGVWWDAGIRNNFPVYIEKGASYIFSFASKADTIRKMHFDVKVGDVKLLDQAIDLAANTKNFAYGFTSTVSGMVTIQLMPTFHGATMYFDDFSFEKVAANQIVNGTFEQDDLPWRFGWGDAAAKFSLDKTSALNGTGSLLIEVTKPSTTGVWWDAGIRNTFNVYVEKGQKYEFKFDSKAAETRQMHFDVKVGDAKLLDKAIDLTTAKQSFTFPFIAGVSGMVTIQWMPTFHGATVYIDNVSLSEAALISVSSVAVKGADDVSEIKVMAGTLQMTAEILPANADIKQVVWSVENGTGEATISEAGLLTAVKDGQVVVKATTTDGSNLVGEKTITISGQTTSVAIIDEQFRIYPNPVVDQLTITSMSNIKNIDIIAIDGRVVQSAKVNGVHAELSVGTLKSGIYLIRIVDENMQVVVRRFVKE